MSEHRDVDLVARLLRDRLQGRDYPPPSAEARGVAIAALERRMIRDRRARRVRTAGIFAAAAAIALVAGYASLRARMPGAAPVASSDLTMTGEGFGQGVSVVGRAGTRSLQARGPLVTGDRIISSAAGWGAIDLATGTHLVVERQSEVAIDRADREQRFVLAHGSLRADVAHLRAGERFIIATADAEVEVRGTSFRVSVVPVECAGASQTQVAVYEGLVQVRHGGREFAVARGETWALQCEERPMETAALAGKPEPRPARSSAHATKTEASVPGARVAATTTRTSIGSARVSLSPAEAAPAVPSESGPRIEPAPADSVVLSSKLALQNQMFADAVAARRAGDNRKALAVFERLEERYPDGPLAESSMVERLRILKVDNPAAAAALARTYLSRFPSGFARAEAQALSSR